MLSFDQWRINFLSDAEARCIHRLTEMKGDVAMRLFWERGTAPTVQAVLDRRMRAERRRGALCRPPRIIAYPILTSFSTSPE